VTLRPKAMNVGLAVRAAALLSVASLAMLGCEGSRSNARGPGYGPYPQAPYGQPAYGPYAQQGAPVPTLNRPMTVGSAFTGFGVIFDQLPQLTFPFPPLPSSSPDPSGQGGQPQQGGWTLPWPGGQSFPFPFPGGGPGAEPAPPSGNWPAAWSAFEDEVLLRTNDVRARGAVCGGQQMPPAGPVSPNGALRAAARGHSQDMAQRNYFEHSTPEGVTPAQRAKNAGYPSGFVGENIAAGQPTPASVVQAWVDSPGHCVNMMDPRYRVLGVGYFFEDGNDRYNHYWSQEFGG
jgi:uncharacterized protein YkwD